MGTRPAQDPDKPRKKKSYRKRSDSKHLTAQVMEFCLKRAYGDSLRTISLTTGIPFGSCFRLLQRPEVIAQINVCVEQLKQDIYAKERKARILGADFLDEQVINRLRRTKKTTGTTVDLIKTGYEAAGIIQRTVNVSASANAQAQAGAAAGASMFEVYEPMWLREKKAQMDQQLSEKYAAQLSDGRSATGSNPPLALEPETSKL